MFWKGRSSFLQAVAEKMWNGPHYCVNALKGATFISTAIMANVNLTMRMCQCPERGDLHFYVTGHAHACPMKMVSMPWKGRPPFLLGMAQKGVHMKIIKRNGAEAELCQCPERGDLHFYTNKPVVKEFETTCVNALKGATSISTEPSIKAVRKISNCVNALKGATSISTLDSGNPHK